MCKGPTLVTSADRTFDDLRSFAQLQSASPIAVTRQIDNKLDALWPFARVAGFPNLKPVTP